jgi:glycosyltransferase involved in cell wall biosynthesis
VNVSVLVATYGDPEWGAMARNRAVPSARLQRAHEVNTAHYIDGTIASARNALASWASGDWLCFLDADDELAPGYIEAMSVAVHQNLMDPMKLYTPAVRHVKKGRPGAPFFFDRGISLREDNWLVVGTLVHKDLFFEVGGFGDYPHGFEDFSLWSKCFRAGAQVIKVPDAVYVYHHNPQSKHKQGWRDRKWQVETHQRVVRELDEWEAARA